MKPILTILALIIVMEAKAQDTTKHRYTPNPSRQYQFQFKGTTSDLQGLFNVVQSSTIDNSPNLSGAQIQYTKKVVSTILDTLVAQYRRQFVSDSLKFVKGGGK